MPAIELKNVNKYYGSGSARVHVLKDVNFSAELGEVVLILGPSGAGKSTFLTIAGGLLTATNGQVAINDINVSQLSKKEQNNLRLNEIGFILQSYNLVPFLTVNEQFKLVDKVKKSDNLSFAAMHQLAEKLDIVNLQHKYPSELSGGQKQRVALQRALYTDPTIVLADEPTAALDSQRVTEVGQLLKDLAKSQNKAVIVVTHDLRLTDHADKIYDLNDGQLTLRS